MARLGNAPFDATLTIAAAQEATNGQIFVPLCGTSGNQRRCIQLGVNIFGYRLGTDQATATVAAGETATFTITAESLGGDVPDVELEVVDAPPGATVEFSVPAGTPFEDFPFTTTLSVATTGETPPGFYTLLVRANGEGLQRTQELELAVEAP